MKNTKTTKKPPIIKKKPISFTILNIIYHVLQTQLIDILKEMAVFIYYFYQ